MGVRDEGKTPSYMIREEMQRKKVRGRAEERLRYSRKDGKGEKVVFGAVMFGGDKG